MTSAYATPTAPAATEGEMVTVRVPRTRYEAALRSREAFRRRPDDDDAYEAAARSYQLDRQHLADAVLASASSASAPPAAADEAYDPAADICAHCDGDGCRACGGCGDRLWDERSPEWERGYQFATERWRRLRAHEAPPAAAQGEEGDEAMVDAAMRAGDRGLRSWSYVAQCEARTALLARLSTLRGERDAARCHASERVRERDQARAQYDWWRSEAEKLRADVAESRRLYIALCDGVQAALGQHWTEATVGSDIRDVVRGVVTALHTATDQLRKSWAEVNDLRAYGSNRAPIEHLKADRDAALAAGGRLREAARRVVHGWARHGIHAADAADGVELMNALAAWDAVAAGKGG